MQTSLQGIAKKAKEKQRDGSLFGNALVNNRITSIFLNRKGVPSQ